MRSLILAIALLAFVTPVDAKPRRAKKNVATTVDKSSKSRAMTKREAKAKGKRKRLAIGMRRPERFVLNGPAEGQSLGACWLGRLREPAKLREGKGYVIRRPFRAFGTDSTVEFVERILADIVDRFPDIHDLAVGDISVEDGGRISEHSSHQSGRDIDVGLIYTKKPDGYPQNFVIATADTLDVEATFVLIDEFARTSRDPAGVQMIFLDFELQGLLYNWAIANGESPEHMAMLFQYPHGRGANAGIVRHEPHHADHIHVRFRCPSGNTACR